MTHETTTTCNAHAAARGVFYVYPIQPLFRSIVPSIWWHNRKQGTNELIPQLTGRYHEGRPVCVHREQSPLQVYIIDTTPSDRKDERECVSEIDRKDEK